MKLLKKVASVFIASTVMLSSFSVRANSNNEESAIIAGGYLSQTIYEILEYYYYQDVSAEEMYEAAMQGMFSLLDDYSVYLPQDEFNYYSKFEDNITGLLNFNIDNKDGRFFIKEVIKNDSKVNIGDEILSINNKSVYGMSDLLFLNQIYRSGKKLNVEVFRDNKKILLELEKNEIDDGSFIEGSIKDVAPKVKDDDGSIKYISLLSIDFKTKEKFIKTIEEYKNQGVKGIILDLRNNSGGTISDAFEICDMLIPAGPIISMVDSKGERTIVSTEKIKEAPFEVAVLTNEYTASAAELIALALKETGSVTVGEKTFGKGVGQIVLEGGLKGTGYKITFMEFFGKGGEKVQGVGIKPDLYVYSPDFIFSSNVDAANVKQILKRINFETGSIDSTWDTVTVSSIKKLQKLFEIPETGRVDENTILAINYALYFSMTQHDEVLLEAYNYLKG